MTAIQIMILMFILSIGFIIGVLFMKIADEKNMYYKDQIQKVGCGRYDTSTGIFILGIDKELK